MWTCYEIHKEYFIKLKDRGQDLIGIFSWTNLPNPSNPLIDLNPSDESCIYSTLIHITDQAKYLNVEIPCVTLLPIVVD